MTRNINRPIGRLDSKGQLSQDSFLDEAFRGEYSGDNLIYKGFAKPGSDEDALVWQIALITYSGSNVISITWPINSEGAPSSDYEFSWTDRAGYTYI